MISAVVRLAVPSAVSTRPVGVRQFRPTLPSSLRKTLSRFSALLVAALAGSAGMVQAGGLGPSAPIHGASPVREVSSAGLPEPLAIVAVVVLLLPFAFSTLRNLRKARVARPR